jgi:hypothetical protein
MKLRRLNDRGIGAFEKFITDKSQNKPFEPDNKKYSDEIDSAVTLEDITFENRFELGKYLSGKFGDTNVNDTRDHRMWAWACVFYFEQLFPKGVKRVKKGERYIGDEGRYIPTDSYKSYYRHQLSGPFSLYRLHGGKARIFLLGHIHEFPEIAEQVAAVPHLVTSTGFIDLVNSIYLNKDGRIKRGASSKTRGSIRRLKRLMDQFSLTWDISQMSGEQLAEMLTLETDEFDKFTK